MIKSYTDLEQSKKLTQILPLGSADMHYSKDFDGSWFADLAEYASVKIPKYVDKVEEHLLPCWSLAALLDVIPCGQVNKISDSNKYEASSWNNSGLEIPIYTTVEEFDNPVDACYELIVYLHELKML